ncbi:helix-turn-helix domain-containing protein [Priestia megaterium]|uniref:helix-turn-helix domain-containing protein n=1 Tax=Priestia megaterium TaxID=1404 RepID=UPI002E23AC3F|nr:helix-turn-helix domain-containing protein [Priestia megaterium]
MENNFSIKETAKKLDIKSTNSIYNMLNDERFPNAFKEKGKWRIPSKDITNFKKQLNIPKDCLDTTQVAKELGYARIIKLLQKNKFPNAFQLHRKWWIPRSDVENFKSLNKRDDSLDLKEAAIELGYKSRQAVNYLIKSGKFPNAYLLEGRWRIPLKDIQTFKKDANQNNYLTSSQTRARLNYKAAFSIIQLIEKGEFPNAFKFNNKWRIPIEDIEAFERKLNPADCLNVKQLTERLGYKSTLRVTELIRNNKFPNAFKHLEKWLIPIQDIEMYKKQCPPSNFLDTKEAANRLGYSNSAKVLQQIKKNIFPNAIKFNGKWQIPVKDIDAYVAYQSIQLSRKKRTKPSRQSALQDNCIDVETAAEKLKLQNKKYINNLIKKNKFPNAFKESKKWWIPVNDIKLYQESINETLLKYLNTKQASKRLQYSSPGVITLMIKQQKFPNALKLNGQWLIPLSDVENFENQKRQKNLTIEYSGKHGFEDIKKFISSQEEKINLKDTKYLFLDYCLLQTNNMSGSTGYIRDRINLFKRLYGNINSKLKKDIYLLSSEEINSYLGVSSPLTKSEKKVFVQFIKYVYEIKNIKSNEEFVLSTDIRKTGTDKEIYSAKLFYKLYNHIKNIEIHVLLAIKDRYYANMWSYTILLLTDFIRGQDLILNTPNINLEEININSIQWFNENILSDFQAQSIVNQLYIHFRNKRTSKTKELLTFLVSPDLVHALATSLVISEFHRRQEKSKLLLDTFVQGRYRVLKTEGKRRHKQFFNTTSDFKKFYFSSQKMNRSVGTYLFYSITEEDKYDGELALYLTQRARSHKTPETTSLYIQATNKDGTINRVSYNLFKRGHFGWLYNYIIMYVSQNRQLNNNLEERSNLIKTLRKDINPKTLENLSEFITQHLNLVPFNNKDDKMNDYLNSIYQKRQSVISKLNSYSEDNIKTIIINLAKGNMPSKSEHAQCLVYPNCKYPNLAKCYSCEYVIPQNFFLIQLNEELNRLIKNIESHSNNLLIVKDTKFLLHAMLIWKEARLAFGQEKVNSFINSKETWKNIEGLAHKLYLE